MKHLKENNETYFSHLKFAGSLGLNFLYRAIFFLVHGVFPMIQVPKSLNIDASVDWLDDAKKYISERGK